MHDPETVLHYLDTLLEESNFTKAARALYISQPYLTQTIKRLEEKLGIKLINRTVPFTLTEAGTIYYKYLESSVASKRKLHSQLIKYENPKLEVIRISVLESLGCFLIPAILPDFLKSHPNIKVQLSEVSPRTSENLLLAEEVDCYLGQTPKALSKGIKPYINGNEKYYIVIPANSKFYQAGKFILEPDAFDLKTLLQQPFLLSNGSSAIRHQVDGLFQKYKINPNIILESQNILTTTGLAINGMGLTISSASILKRYKETPLNLLPISPDLLSIDYFIAVKQGRTLTPGIQDLITAFMTSNLSPEIK